MKNDEAVPALVRSVLSGTGVADEDIDRALESAGVDESEGLLAALG